MNFCFLQAKNLDALFLMATFRRKKKTCDQKSSDKVGIDYRQSFIHYGFILKT
jgi:hypothetical protein